MNAVNTLVSTLNVTSWQPSGLTVGSIKAYLIVGGKRKALAKTQRIY